MKRTASLIILAGVVAVGCGTPLDSGDDVQVVPSALQSVGAQYPAVVGEVNGVSISGRELGLREYFVREGNPSLGAAETRKMAVHAIVEDRVLLQAAAREGLVVDRRDVLDEIGRLRSAASNDRDLRAAFRATAKQLGITEDQVFTDERVVAVYQQAFTLGRMREHVAESLPVERRADPAAAQGAVDQFVAERQPQVRMLIAP
jgi:hypothetical protein